MASRIFLLTFLCSGVLSAEPSDWQGLDAYGGASSLEQLDMEMDGHHGASDDGHHGSSDDDHHDSSDDGHHGSSGHGSHGSGEHGEHGEHGDHVPYSTQEYNVGFTFLQVVIAACVLLHLSTSRRLNERKTFWILINNSISVFLAVFVFQSSSRLFESMLEPLKDNRTVLVLIQRGIAILWWFLMMVVMGWTACLGRKELREKTIEDPVKMQKASNLMHIWLFLAHVSAFTGMEAHAGVLHGDAFLTATFERKKTEIEWQIGRALLRYTLFLVSAAFVRSYLLKRCFHDHKNDHLLAEWEEMVEEGEHDLFAIMTSYLLTIYLILRITGENIFTEAGHQAGDSMWKHKWEDAGFLFLCSLGFLAVAFAWGAGAGIYLGLQGEEHHQHHGNHGDHGNHADHGHHESEDHAPKRIITPRTRTGSIMLRKKTFRQGSAPHEGRQLVKWGWDAIKANARKRLRPLLRTLFLMCFAWCFLFATQWETAHVMIISPLFTAKKAEEDSKHLFNNRISLNLNTTFFAAIFIMVFVKVVNCSSQEVRDDEMNPIGATLNQMMLGMGFLIGFSWEQCFNEAINAIVERLEENEEMEAEWSAPVIGVAGTAAVATMWFNIILPMWTERGYHFGFIPGKAAEKLAKMRINYDQKVDYCFEALEPIVNSLEDQAAKRKLVEKLEELVGYSPPHPLSGSISSS